ncbi:nibrin [Trichonephila clavipes]|nr:nibrin [Trichonephila clavipes]
MTGHIYRDVILEQHVRLFRGAMGAEFLFIRPSSPCKHCRRMPSIGGYHPYGLAGIITGLESNRACVGAYKSKMVTWLPLPHGESNLSARASVLKRLDTIHHSALRICSLVPSELRLLPACMWYAINPL